MRGWVCQVKKMSGFDVNAFLAGMFIEPPPAPAITPDFGKPGDGQPDEIPAACRACAAERGWFEPLGGPCCETCTENLGEPASGGQLSEGPKVWALGPTENLGEPASGGQGGNAVMAPGTTQGAAPANLGDTSGGPHPPQQWLAAEDFTRWIWNGERYIG